jgi:hypothetical protein
MRMEDKEIKFWVKVDKLLTIWNKMNGKLLFDYHERLRLAKMVLNMKKIH